jgi:deazaflavin-dependent oxidoreductase (nitroreductase family)
VGKSAGGWRYGFAVPVTLPRALARFNRVVTNPVQGVYAWALPPWAVLVHRGRRSGRLYRTPVVALRRARKLRVAVLYGEQSDWVQNLLAAGTGQVVRGGRTYELIEPRLSGRFLVAELGEPTRGFGRGPMAG